MILAGASPLPCGAFRLPSNFDGADHRLLNFRVTLSIVSISSVVDTMRE